MRSTVRRVIATSAAAAGLVVVMGAAAPAYAADDFGQHVRTCGQTMGFDGTMDPGMHRGYAGSDPSMVC